MIKLVKIGKEIVRDGYGFHHFIPEVDNTKYLILPEGLDALEDMIQNHFIEDGYHYEGLYENISSVFARFKKENEI